MRYGERTERCIRVFVLVSVLKSRFVSLRRYQFFNLSRHSRKGYLLTFSIIFSFLPSGMFATIFNHFSSFHWGICFHNRLSRCDKAKLKADRKSEFNESMMKLISWRQSTVAYFERKVLWAGLGAYIEYG